MRYNGAHRVLALDYVETEFMNALYVEILFIIKKPKKNSLELDS